MRQIHRHLVAASLVAAGIANAGTARGGPIADWFGCGDCPPPAYSPFRYWAPALARLHDKFHGPSLPVYAPERHPEIPADNHIVAFPCPPVAPAETLIPVPTPPATSAFRY
jgi:hypothetical protein